MKHKPSGYDLFQTLDANWIFSAQGAGMAEGSFDAILRFMISAHGFNIHDIEQGVEMMIGCDHDSIHFGMYKSPIFTKTRQEQVA